MEAKDTKCCKCGKQAVAMYPFIDPDIPSYPYCADHLEQAMIEVAKAVWKNDKGMQAIAIHQAKEAVKKIKLQIPAGKATPAPPVGTVLGPAGINLQEFCTKYNDATRDKMGQIIPVVISLYDDRSYDFVLKTPPTPSSQTSSTSR